MAVALQGAVVISERLGLIENQLKCDKCGSLHGGRIGGDPPPEGGHIITTFKCMKCGNMHKCNCRQCTNVIDVGQK